MQTVEQFIDALGGTVAVATALDLAPTTVSSWKSSGSIPKWRRDGLRPLAEQKCVDFPDEFAPPVAAQVGEPAPPAPPQADAA